MSSRLGTSQAKQFSDFLSYTAEEQLSWPGTTEKSEEVGEILLGRNVTNNTAIWGMERQKVNGIDITYQRIKGVSRMLISEGCDRSGLGTDSNQIQSQAM